MNKFVIILISILLLAGCSFGAKNKEVPVAQENKPEQKQEVAAEDKFIPDIDAPKFEDYPATIKFNGKPAAPNFNTNTKARMYRTVITEEATEGPNFAGGFTLISYGCGTNCHLYTILNAKTGAVVSYNEMSSAQGEDIRLDSRLIVLEPPEILFEMFGKDAPDYFQTSYYYLTEDGKKIVKIVYKTKIYDYLPPIQLDSKGAREGSCWTNSIAIPYRDDAWRCVVGNEILDPCFKINGYENLDLICQNNPKKPDERVDLKLTEPLPDFPKKENSQKGAWFLELEDGSTCSPITGASDVNKKGERANYACSKGGDIYGELNEGKVWTTSDGQKIDQIWR
jgi:hypothetical protein